MLIPGLVSVTFRQLTVPEIGELATECGLQAVEWGGDVHVPPGDFAAAHSGNHQRSNESSRMTSACST